MTTHTPEDYANPTAIKDRAMDDLGRLAGLVLSLPDWEELREVKWVAAGVRVAF